MPQQKFDIEVDHGPAKHPGFRSLPKMDPYCEIHEVLPGLTDDPVLTELRFGDPLDLTEVGQRHPVTRTGEREPIPWPVRYAVAMRDDFTCQHCHSDTLSFGYRRDLEIDHVIPWSAGGSDRSSNLRALCKPCNQSRSNFHDWDERPQIPVTWWCVQCWNHVSRIRDPWHFTHKAPIEPMWDANIAHRVEDAVVTAFCGFCRHLSMTDVTL